jgi:predicted DNA-binding transcriptional regulator AlpA
MDLKIERQFWLFMLFVFGNAALFASDQVYTMIFDSGTISLPVGTTVSSPPSSLQIVGGFPETPGDGVAATWVEKGNLIYTMLFDSSTVYPPVVYTASSEISQLEITGDYPEVEGLGAALTWVENGNLIYTKLFDSVNVYAPVVYTASSEVSNLINIGNFPEEQTFGGAAAAWIQNGNEVFTMTFDSGGLTPPVSTTAGSDVSNLVLTGGAPDDSSIGGGAVAWLENSNQVWAMFYTRTTHSDPMLITTSSSPVSYLSLTGDFPTGTVGAYAGLALAWLEGDNKIYTVLFDRSTVNSPVVTTATSAVSNLLLTGSIPASDTPNQLTGALTWIQNDNEVYTMIFDNTGHDTPVVTTASSPVSNLLLTGDFPASMGLGAAVAWVENDSQFYTMTFDSYGTNTPVLTNATSTIFYPQLSGIYPELVSNGAAAAWITTSAFSSEVGFPSTTLFRQVQPYKLSRGLFGY